VADVVAWLDGAASTLGVREGMSFQVGNERRNAHHFHVMTGCNNGILNKGELGLDLVELIRDALTVVIITVVLLNLSDHIPIIKVGDGLHQQKEIHLIPLIPSYSLLIPLILGVRKE